MIMGNIFISPRSSSVGRLRKAVHVGLIALVPRLRPAASAEGQPGTAPGAPQPHLQKPEAELLNLTCKDIEEIVYAKLNWPR
jgi:hypothetical protein